MTGILYILYISIATILYSILAHKLFNIFGYRLFLKHKKTIDLVHDMERQARIDSLKARYMS